MTDLYSEWRDFYAEKVSSWMTLEELRIGCGKLLTVDNPSPEVLLIHAMHALEEYEQRNEALRAEVERLRVDLMESDEIREKLGHLLTRTAAALKGEPPAGVWHSWHDLPEKATQLAEALRELEDREQRDEALLREALYALEYASDMTKPDDLQGCGCPICTNIAALRERLGEGEQQ